MTAERLMAESALPFKASRVIGALDPAKLRLPVLLEGEQAVISLSFPSSDFSDIPLC